MRNTILATALLLGGGLSISIITFGAIAEPVEFDVYSVVFAILAGIVFSSPLWLAAIIPAKAKIASRIFRWFGAATLIFPLSIAFDMISNFISRYLSDRGPYFPAVLEGIVIAGISIACMAALIWPDLRSWKINPRSPRRVQ